MKIWNRSVLLLCCLAFVTQSNAVESKPRTSKALSTLTFDDMRDIAHLKKALARGADVNAKDEQGDTPLISCAHDAYFGNQKIKIAETLIAHGAAVNTPNRDGQTALMIAALNDWPELINLLLKNGAKIEARDNDGKTALLYAAGGVMTEIGTLLSVPESVRYLLRKGANANARDKTGQTALILAAKASSYDQGHRETALQSVRLLLRSRADAKAVTKNGNTAMKWALVRHHLEIVALLRAYGITK